MKTGTFVLAAVGIAFVARLAAGPTSQTAGTGSTLAASEAMAHVGSAATVCGKVMSPRYAKSSRGQPTFLDIDKPYPDQQFAVVTWGSDRPKFGEPESAYRDKNICVTGKIQAYQGRAEIVATDPAQIKVSKSL